jgi:hypothetical protein
MGPPSRCGREPGAGSGSSSTPPPWPPDRFRGSVRRAVPVPYFSAARTRGTHRCAAPRCPPG